MGRTAARESRVGRPRLSPKKKLVVSSVSLPPSQWEQLDAIVEEFNRENPDDLINRGELVRQLLDWAITEYSEEGPRSDGNPLKRK